MKKLLFIKASPREERSVTITLAREFLAAYQARHSDAVIDEIDLWKAGLPEFDGDRAAAKMSFFGEPAMDGTQKSAYDELVEIFNRFNAADEYLFATPMWNFGLPYKLKQYIDLLTMPGTLFGFDPAVGYIGLLKEKRATAIYSAGIYMPGLSTSFGYNHVSPALEDWLAFAGVTDVAGIWYYGNKMRQGAEADEAYARVVAEVRAAAQR